MNIGWSFLQRLIGRQRQPLTEEQINALAKDADRFENEYAWCDPRIEYGDDR
jgi:hypothetical protein